MSIENEDMGVDLDQTSSSSEESLDTSAEETREDASSENTGSDSAPTSMMEAMQRALAESENKEEKTEEQEPQKADEEQTKDPVEEKIVDYTEVKFDEKVWKHTPKEARRAIEQFREKTARLSQELETVSTKSRSFDELQGFIRSSGLDQDTFQNALVIMGEIRSNPERALERLRPTIEYLNKQTGISLPADLQEDVETGGLSEERAQELARARAQGQRLQSEVQARNEREALEQAHRQAEEARVQVHQAARDWESRWKETDADYQKKMPFVQDRVMAKMQDLQSEGKVVTPQVALELLNSARSHVEKNFSSILPPPKEMRPVTTNGSRSQPKTAPKSMLDAMKQTWANMGNS